MLYTKDKYLYNINHDLTDVEIKNKSSAKMRQKQLKQVVCRVEIYA